MDRTEQVMEIVEAAITGLETTGSNVKRARHYPWPDDIDYALSLSSGQIDRSLNQYRGRTHALSVLIDGHVKLPAEDHDTVINRIDAEVYAAIMAAFRARTSGDQAAPTYLGWIDSVNATLRSQPNFSVAGEQRISEFTITYVVTFQTSLDDLSV